MHIKNCTTTASILYLVWGERKEFSVCGGGSFFLSAPLLFDPNSARKPLWLNDTHIKTAKAFHGFSWISVLSLYKWGQDMTRI